MPIYFRSPINSQSPTGFQSPINYRKAENAAQEETIELAASEDQKDPNYSEKAYTTTKDIYEKFGISYKPEGSLEIADYRKMMLDPQVKLAVMMKIYARMSSGWDFVPASSDPLDIEVAEYTTAMFERMTGTIEQFLANAMKAMAYSLTVHEIVLEPIMSGRWKGKVGLKALKWKRPENFKCKTDKYGNLESLLQKRDNDWVPLDPNYFVIWPWDHEGDWKGKSDLNASYRWVKGKDLVDRIWNIFLEKHATPMPIGKHPPGAKDSEKKKISDLLKKLAVGTSVVASNKWEFGVLESAREGGDYEEKVQYCDRQILHSLLMPSLIADEGERGARALGVQHMDNLIMVLDAFGAVVADNIMGEQTIKRLVDFNYQVEIYPKFVWRPLKDVDMEKVATALEKLKKTGIIGPTEKWIRELLRVPPAEETEGAPPPSTPVAGDPAGGGGQGGDVAMSAPNGCSCGCGGSRDPAVLFAARTASAAKLKHGKKHDWRDLSAWMDETEDAAVAKATDVVESMLVGLKKTVKSKQIVEKRDYAAVEKLRLKNVGKYRDTLAEVYGHALHKGAFDALREVEEGLAAVGVTPEWSLPSTMGINFIGQAEIVAAWQDKVPIQKKLLAEYNRHAFTVSGANSDKLLKEAQLVIEAGIRHGSTYAQIAESLNDVFAPYLEIPGAVDPGVANPYRLTNVVRTGMSEAYNSGRMNLFRHPEVGAYITAFEYSAIVDDRTTEFCLDWHGTVLRADDPRISANNPPNHYQCRSVWIPVVRGEKFEVGRVDNTDFDNPIWIAGETPSSVPAKGFKY